MSVDRDRPPLFPASGAGGWLREGVARRPGMAGGMSTDGSRLTPTVYMSRQPAGSQSVLTIGFESTPRLYQKSETPLISSTVTPTAMSAPAADSRPGTRTRRASATATCSPRYAES